MPLLYKVFGALALVAALFMAVNWYNGHQQGIGYQKAIGEYKAKESADLKAALLETGRLNGLIKEAANAALKQEQEKRDLAARNAVLLGKLRDSDGRINTLASAATADALRNATRAYGALFGECREAYEEMGRFADGHRIDAQNLRASWPN